MGLLDNLRDKAETLGDKAKDRAADGFDAAKDKATDLIGGLQERFDGEDTPADLIDGCTGGASGSAQDAYDEVLDAAELKAEALKTNPGPPEVQRYSLVG